jgi:hypothetical protein
LYDNSGVYWPGQNINSLSGWNAQDCFYIKTTEAFNLNISALAFADHELNIEIGWNIIPCLSNEIVDIEELIESNSDIIIIKEIAGTKVYWPSMEIFTLEELLPGKAYLLFSNDEFEIEFPEIEDN